MGPTSLDLKIIRLLAPLEAKPFWVDAINSLSQNSLVNGFVYAVPLFLFWHFSERDRRQLAQRMMLTIFMGTVIGALGSLLLQQWIRWPPPAANPALASVYAPTFRQDTNPSSFPSDSAMLYSTVAFGTTAWSHWLSAGLLAWLLIFVAPAKLFVGGHYPTDILAGLLLGLLSYRLSRYLMMRFRFFEVLASSQSPLLRVVLFCWLFEVGNEFRDLRQVINDLWHIRIHL